MKFCGVAESQPLNWENGMEEATVFGSTFDDNAPSDDGVKGYYWMQIIIRNAVVRERET